MILRAINIPVFVISFLLGLFFIYIVGPELKQIEVYPGPDNIDKILYKDRASNCFAFEAHSVQCPTQFNLFSIPIQE
jgi:hypothetical protein